MNPRVKGRGHLGTGGAGLALELCCCHVSVWALWPVVVVVGFPPGGCFFTWPRKGGGEKVIKAFRIERANHLL